MRWKTSSVVALILSAMFVLAGCTSVTPIGSSPRTTSFHIGTNPSDGSGTARGTSMSGTTASGSGDLTASTHDDIKPSGSDTSPVPSTDPVGSHSSDSSTLSDGKSGGNIDSPPSARASTGDLPKPTWATALNSGIGWVAPPTSTSSAGTAATTIYYTPGADVDHLSNDARKLVTVPATQDGLVLSLTGLSSAGDWLLYTYKGAPSASANPNLAAIEAINVSTGVTRSIWKGPLTDTSQVLYALSPSDILLETGTASGGDVILDQCILISLASNKKTPVQLSAWADIYWTGYQFGAVRQGKIQSIDPASGMVTSANFSTLDAYRSELDSMLKTVKIPLFLPLNPPAPSQGQYYYVQYESLSDEYSVSLYSSPQQLAPNSPTSYGNTSLLGSIHAASGTGTVAANGEIPRTLSAATVTVTSSQTISLIDGQKGRLLHAIGAGGGDAGYYVQWYHLGWLYTWGSFSSLSDVNTDLPQVNEIVERYAQGTPVPGVSRGEVSFLNQPGKPSSAIWNMADTYFVASANDSRVTDFIQSLAPVR